MNLWDNIGDLLAKAGHWVGDAISTVFHFGKDVVSDVLPKPPGGGGTVPGSGGGNGGGTPGDDSPGSPGGSFTGIFTEPVAFLRHLTEEQTWVRVGLVLLGILLIALAVRMMLRNQNPIKKTMDAIGLK